MRQRAISALSCDSMAVVVAVAHFDRHLAGRAISCHREIRAVFVVCSFGLLHTFSKTNFSLILKISRSLFVYSLHLQALVNVNIAF